MARPSKYPTELRERAVRFVIEVRGDHSSDAAGACARGVNMFVESRIGIYKTELV